ncbi:MAG: efflux RND transporter permease subunit, partial [Crocinitomicaceae bacterium]|nr:efflux RND transporter permease subunit [Crocinitomicaceae bacterium]
GAAINIEVTGRGEYRDLIHEAEKIKEFLKRKNVKGVEDLKLNVDANRPEYAIKVDKQQVGVLNTSTFAVGQAIRKALLGQDITTFTIDDESYDITVRFNKKNRENLNSLLD